MQERVALARRAIEKNGPDALKDWAPMYLFYGCRKSTEDFLYRDEWPKYEEELKGKLQMRVAFSRESKKADGSESSCTDRRARKTSAQTPRERRTDDTGKVYVQDLIWDERTDLAALILDKRAYIYICGDAKSMAKSVEDKLMRMLAEARNGSAEVEGAKELKLLKDRNVRINFLSQLRVCRRCMGNRRGCGRHGVCGVRLTT